MDGTTIGPYRVTGVIGQGGMGAVYAAEHVLLGRQAAIKVLLPDLSRKQEIVLRFFNEARAATAIRHPGIVEIYDFGWTPDGAAYIVMERLDGETLARRAARGKLRWQAATVIARQIAGALGAAHAKGIVHRDLKPENVFLVPDPEVPGGERIKLLDFGIAKLAGDSSATVNVTKTGAVMGTPTYMSPEQCRGVAVDHRADLYALGCVVFELCCGRPPFLGEGSGDVLAAHIHMPPPTLTRLGVEVPPAFEQLVGRLLTKPPAARVQSADELIRAIDALTVEPAAAVSLPSGGPRPVTESPSMTTLSGASTSRLLPSALTSNQRRSVAIVASVAATLTVAVVAVVMLRSGEAPPAAHAGPPSKGAPAPSPVPIEPAPRTAVASPPVARAPEPTAVVTPGSAAAAPPPSVSIAPDPAPAEPTPEPTRPAMSKLDKPTRPEPARPTMPKVEKPTRPEPDKPMTSPSPIRSTPPRNIERSQPANVELAIETTPPGAQVLLAGKGLGKTPFHGYLPRGDGNVTLVVRLSGYIDRTVVVHPDRAIRERVKLVPARGKRDQSVNPF